MLKIYYCGNFCCFFFGIGQTFSVFPAGFEFFQSANGVILCAGDENGFLPTNLFTKVVHRKRGKKIKVNKYLQDSQMINFNMCSADVTKI